MSADAHLQQRWYGAPGWLRLLAPLEWIFRLVTALRRGLYRAGVLRSEKLPVPVIVVGNISVGGTGKTPIVIALCEALQRAGLSPGIVSRGYGAQPPQFPYRIDANSTAREAGDEPLLLALNTQCPVVIAPDRVAAARHLLAGADCDVIISDDGLQHLRLRRDIEWVVVDGARGFGNGHCLPVGPLREPRARLAAVDAVLVNASTGTTASIGVHPHLHPFQLRPRAFVALDDGRAVAPVNWAQPRVHAVAGIGNPARFFDTLRALGLDVIEHAFPDHHAFSADDLAFADALPVVMTEKDAVKCVGLELGSRACWYLAVEAVVPDSLLSSVIGRIASLR
ncbi:MAG: tetraacyldisaccharide 4'-kinase [Thauera sp.]|jgi:tetraacyldisaccharide 4'-kinase|nr:tetraacyldisaccharide 4'-kinase [Thauera sp.]